MVTDTGIKFFFQNKIRYSIYSLWKGVLTLTWGAINLDDKSVKKEHEGELLGEKSSFTSFLESQVCLNETEVTK